MGAKPKPKTVRGNTVEDGSRQHRQRLPILTSERGGWRQPIRVTVDRPSGRSDPRQSLPKISIGSKGLVLQLDGIVADDKASTSSTNSSEQYNPAFVQQLQMLSHGVSHVLDEDSE